MRHGRAVRLRDGNPFPESEVVLRLVSEHHADRDRDTHAECDLLHAPHRDPERGRDAATRHSDLAAGTTAPGSDSNDRNAARADGIGHPDARGDIDGDSVATARAGRARHRGVRRAGAPHHRRGR